MSSMITRPILNLILGDAKCEIRHAEADLYFLKTVEIKELHNTYNQMVR